VKDKKGEHPFGDLGQLVCAGVFAVVWAADSFFFHWSTFLARAVPNALRMSVLGVALLFTFALLWTAHPVITGEKRPDHVIDTGPFRHVRHPLYLAALLAYIGTAMSSMSLLSLALLVPIFLFYDYIAAFEERVLETKFGDTYRDYEAKTGKWLPTRVRKSREPAP
jgi:protein-S-isoprenylcysteine O-methyltransferase Ste14